MGKKIFEQKLRMYHNEYEKTKKLIQKVGFIAEGSVTKIYSRCGKINCQCQKHKKYRHGPYYQLTWKEKGKTVTRYLSNETAQLYQEYVDNRQNLKSIISTMSTISLKARKCFFAIKDIPHPNPKIRKIPKKMKQIPR